MGTIHYDRRPRIALSWRVAAGVASAGLGVVVAVGLWPPSMDAPPPVPPAAVDCCRPPAPAAGRAAPRRADVAVATPARPPAADAADAADADGARAYRMARRYADCRLAAEAPPQDATDVMDERYDIDPSGGFAAALDRAQRQAREACLDVGPAEYRQVEALMRAAARRGNIDARFHVVRQAVASLLQRQDDDPASCIDGTAALGEVEQLAAQGQRGAIELAGQLLASGRIVTPDPVRAAAWGLVGERQAHGAPLTAEQIDGSGLLSALDRAGAAQARRLAATLPAGGSQPAAPRCAGPAR